VTEQHTGFVYAIRDFGRRATKIGFSGNPKRRVRQLQTATAEVLHLGPQIPGDRSLERALHQHFAGHRLKGEWFDDPKSEIYLFLGQMAYRSHVEGVSYV
jgi:hypothetical protein